MCVYLTIFFKICISRIFDEIYSKAPDVLKDLSSISIDVDYKEYIKDFIDFEKSI